MDALGNKFCASGRPSGGVDVEEREIPKRRRYQCGMSRRLAPDVDDDRGGRHWSILTHDFEVANLGRARRREVVGRNQDKGCLQIRPPAPVPGNT